MARVANTLLNGIQGTMGDMIFYQINGVTYTRKKPGKRTNAQKKWMKKSPLNERSQGMFTMVQKYLKTLRRAIAFGYQEHTFGASLPYHACVSYTRKNCFALDGEDYRIDPSLIKVSRGSLLPPEDAKAERGGEGILFTWRNNSWISSARPSDQAFIVIHDTEGTSMEWIDLGNFREQGEHLLKLHPYSISKSWHVYLAFSQKNHISKKRTLSDSVYLGIV
jgi:hypothetical protein